MLLDRANAHQLNQDHVALNPKHANFVFNKGATSDDIINTTLKMQDLVYQEFGVWLEYEMEILGFIPDALLHKILIKREPQYNEKLFALRKEFQSRN